MQHETGCGENVAMTINMTKSDIKKIPLTYGEIEQLTQICRDGTWDGGLVSKDHRTALRHKGLIAQRNGLNEPTCAGEYLWQEIRALFVEEIYDPTITPNPMALDPEGFFLPRALFVEN